MKKPLRLLTLLLILCSFRVFAHSVETQIALISGVKKSVVGIGIYNPLNAPRYQLRGTGFAISSNANSTLIATNHHVVNGEEFDQDNAKISIHVGEGKNAKLYTAELLVQDARVDVAILKVQTKIPALTLDSKPQVPAGVDILIAGLPIGSVLGLYKSVHKGMVAAFVPMAIPQQNARELSIEVIKRLRDPLFVYQLDATAYPGNSGSPVIDANTGKVIGILNSVLVKTTKEHVLSDPSGISYAIPAAEIKRLIKQI